MKYMYSLMLAMVLAASSALAMEEGAKIVDDAFVKAANANDLKALMELYAPDAVAYYPEGEYKGREAIEKSWNDFFSKNTIKSFKINADYNTAGKMSIGWGTWVMTVTAKEDGKVEEMKGRFTDMVKKVGGKWLYVVDHASMAMPPAPPPNKSSK